MWTTFTETSVGYLETLQAPPPPPLTCSSSSPFPVRKFSEKCHCVLLKLPWLPSQTTVSVKIPSMSS